MKKPRMLLSIGLLMAIASVCVQAQERTLLHANLPFAATVEDTKLPAGAYTVYLQNPYNLARIQSPDGRHIATMSFLRTPDHSASQQSKLVFRRIGGQYFLWQIWEAGDDAHRDLRLGKVAKEMLAKNPPNQQVATVFATRGH